LRKQIIENLKIEKLVFKGFGLGFKDFNPIFVYNAVPEDVVDVEIVNKRKNVLFGKIINFQERSKFRITPDCKAFGDCGGCDWLNIPIYKQIQYKNIIIKEVFKNVSIEEVFPIISSEKDRNYRNKSFMPVSIVSNEHVFGMFANKSHRVIPHNYCMLHPEIFDDVSRKFVTYLKAAKVKIYNEKNKTGNIKHIGFRYSFSNNELLVIIVTKNKKLPFTNQLVRTLTESFPTVVGIIQNINSSFSYRILGEEEKLLFGRNWLYDNIGNIKLKLNYRSFSQVNPGITELLYELIKNELNTGSNVIDAFSGVGTIGLYIAEKVKMVYCIENDISMIKDGKINAELNNILNCNFVYGNAETEISNICQNHSIDTVILDPPRKGIDQIIIDTISKNNIRKVIYVSCDPSTQVRDVKRFILKNYFVTKMQPFDMFPHTYHIENVIVMEKVK
jgi:23S rRNA (uracil1939-C5)-methyltransferase